MNYYNRPISIKKTKKNKYIKNHNISKRHGRISLKKIFRYFVLTMISIFLLGGIILAFRMQKNVYSDLPDVKNIKNMVFSQTTEIQDRHGKLLYKLFQENREYVPYDDISKNMINAIVAMEDKRYREHGGLDPWGIIRAIFKNILTGQKSGASTLTQQLLKNLLLNPGLQQETMKEKVIRKLREFVLASKLEKTLQSEIKKTEGKLSQEEIHKKMKEETLELYLNFIGLGNNAYGVEAASQTYFGSSAKDLTILQSAILASLPQAPSYYNPYNNKERIMGQLQITDKDGVLIKKGTGINLEEIAIEKLKNTLTQSDLSNKKENNGFTEFIKGLGSFTVSEQGKSYYVKYKLGRKDAVLARMYEDGYINQTELKNAFLQGLDFQFHKKIFEIKAPHFVQRIIEELEKKYDKEILTKDGLIIKTTLDYDIQKIAEKAIQDNKKNLEYYGANNESMVYVDSLNGDVLAYVGSVDYFNEEIQGQNDMVERPRQPGSTIKPLVYARGFEKLPLTLDTPIYDIPFQIGNLKPHDADGKFYGILPLKNALAYSRNIPAAKIFLAMGGEPIVKPFLRDLGLKSLKENHKYGYSMALGAGEVPVMEMANAYMHLSATGKPAVINPILEITSSDGSIIYQKEVKKQKEVMKPGIAFLLRKILSDKGNMPPGRVSKYSVKGLLLGVKSGTSNMKTPRGDRARDGRLIGYTPSKVTVFRGGNTNGSAMYKNAYGGFLNSHAFLQFRSDLKKNNYIKNEDMTNVETSNVVISKISGKIPGEGTPDKFKVSTLSYAYNQPNTVDQGMQAIKIDKLCNGLVGPYTPKNDIIEGYLITPTSIMPNNMDLNEIKQRRIDSVSKSGFVTQQNLKKKPRVTYNYGNIFIKAPEEYCDGRIPEIDNKIKVNILKPTTNKISQKTSIRYNIDSPKYVQRVIIYVNDEIIATFEENLGRSFTRIENITIPDKFVGKQIILKIEAIDYSMYSNTNSIKVEVTDKTDTTPPKIVKNKIKISGEPGNYRVLILLEDDMSGVSGGKVIRDNKIIENFSGSLINFVSKNLEPITIIASDNYKNTTKQNINLLDYYGYGNN